MRTLRLAGIVGGKATMPRRCVPLIVSLTTLVAACQSADGDRSDTIEIEGPAPHITEIQVLATERSGAGVTFLITVFDNEGDVDPPKSIFAMLRCGGTGYGTFPNPQEVTRTSRNKYEIRAAMSSTTATTASGVCALTMKITDNGGNESNEVETPVDFDVAGR